MTLLRLRFLAKKERHVMPAERLATGLLVAVHLALLSGCQSLYLYRPVTILVRDAETKQPISSAEVHLSYPLTRPSAAPWDALGTTASDGIAHVRAAPFGEAGVRVEATAAGYLPDELSIPAEAIHEIQPAHFFEDVNRRPARFVLEMYAEPRFQVELVLPSGFRGLVKVVVQIQDNMPCPPGLRVFRADVAPSGDALVQGPALLHRVFPPDYRARFADGTVVPRNAGPNGIALRPLKREGDVEFFVVGTQSEYDTIALLDKPSTVENRLPDSGRSAGKGSKRRRGGQGTSSQDGSAGG